MPPSVFLDRDGTLIEEVNYLDRLERLQIFPWSVDAVRLLNRAGFKVAVVTNQAGVAKAMVDEAFVQTTHRLLAETFTAGGARIDGFYYCPHHPEGTLEAYRQACECRKPKPGMLRQAQRDLGADLARSYVVGDKWTDLEAGAAVGAKGVLVRTGYGAREAERLTGGVQAAHVAANLMDATAWILREQRRCA